MTPKRTSWTVPIAAAIAAHAALFPIPLSGDTESTDDPIRVRLHLRATHAEASPTPGAEAPTAIAPTPKPIAPTRTPQPRRRPETPVPDQRPAALASEQPGAADDRDDPLPNRRDATDTFRGPEQLLEDPSLPPPPPVAAEPDYDAYAEQVRRAVEDRKRYPRRARRLGIEGVVTVSVSIQPDGRLAGRARIAASSGSELLDGEAVRMAAAAAPFPPPPRSGDGSGLEIRIPVRFGLR